MTTTSEVCHTFETALDMAITMEERCYRAYLSTLRLVKDKTALSLLKDAAIEVSEHKQKLEIALIEGSAEHLQQMQQEVPIMHLDTLLKQQQIDADATAREALAYIIHIKKNSVDFYNQLVTSCEGAPMAPIFQQLSATVRKQLQQAEDMYEKHFLTEN
ncbi:MAG: ferritin [Desulfuromonas sp.]